MNKEREKEIKYCPKCGFQNNEDAEFCKNCGYGFLKKVKIKEKRRPLPLWVKGLLIIGVAIIFIVPALGAYFIWYKSYETGSPETIFPSQSFFERMEFWHKMTIIGTILGIFVIIILVLYQDRRLKKRDQELKNKKT